MKQTPLKPLTATLGGADREALTGLQAEGAEALAQMVAWKEKQIKLHAALLEATRACLELKAKAEAAPEELAVISDLNTRQQQAVLLERKIEQMEAEEGEMVTQMGRLVNRINQALADATKLQLEEWKQRITDAFAPFYWYRHNAADHAAATDAFSSLFHEASRPILYQTSDELPAGAQALPARLAKLESVLNGGPLWQFTPES